MAFRNDARVVARAIRDIAGKLMFHDANKRMAQLFAEAALGTRGDPHVIRATIERVSRGELHTIDDIAAALCA